MPQSPACFWGPPRGGCCPCCQPRRVLSQAPHTSGQPLPLTCAWLPAEASSRSVGSWRNKGGELNMNWHKLKKGTSFKGHSTPNKGHSTNNLPIKDIFSAPKVNFPIVLRNKMAYPNFPLYIVKQVIFGNKDISYTSSCTLLHFPEGTWQQWPSLWEWLRRVSQAPPCPHTQCLPQPSAAAELWKTVSSTETGSAESHHGRLGRPNSDQSLVYLNQSFLYITEKKVKYNGALVLFMQFQTSHLIDCQTPTTLTHTVQYS